MVLSTNESKRSRDHDDNATSSMKMLLVESFENEVLKVRLGEEAS